MAQTQRSSSTKTSRARKTQALKPNAMLKEDHKRILDMFKEYEKLKGDKGTPAKRQKLALKICEELKVHAALEEEIYYPQVREATGKDDLLDEAEVEHATAEELAEQIEFMSPEDRLYDAKITVLGEYLKHHIKEEQDEMFPLAKKAGLDTEEIGREMKARRKELQKQLH